MMDSDIDIHRSMETHCEDAMCIGTKCICVHYVSVASINHCLIVGSRCTNSFLAQYISMYDDRSIARMIVNIFLNVRVQISTIHQTQYYTLIHLYKYIFFNNNTKTMILTIIELDWIVFRLFAKDIRYFQFLMPDDRAYLDPIRSNQLIG